MAGSRKKKRTHLEMSEEDWRRIPRSLIFRRGQIPMSLQSLLTDFRKIFSPNTSTQLRQHKQNSLRDFLSVSYSLGVSHLLVFSHTLLGPTLRMMRTPNGPTLTFRINEYSSMADIVKQQKRPYSVGPEVLKHPPLIVLNGFNLASKQAKSIFAPAAAPPTAQPASSSSAPTTQSASEPAFSENSTPLYPPSSEHLQIVHSFLQNMFPALDVSSLHLSHCRRVVLFHYHASTHRIDVRHYLITCSPTALPKALKRILMGKLPNLHDYSDFSEYLNDNSAAAAASDSELEDPDSRVELSQSYVGRGNVAKGKSAVRLKEVGPRLSISLMKLEENVGGGGKVLYHAWKRKSEMDEKRMEEKVKQREEEKDRQRKKWQEKLQEKEKNKKGKNVKFANEEEDNEQDEKYNKNKMEEEAEEEEGEEKQNDEKQDSQAEKKMVSEWADEFEADESIGTQKYTFDDENEDDDEEQELEAEKKYRKKMKERAKAVHGNNTNRAMEKNETDNESAAASSSVMLRETDAMEEDSAGSSSGSQIQQQKNRTPRKPFKKNLTSASSSSNTISNQKLNLR